MRKLIVYLLSILSLFSLGYYSAKFYADKKLIFTDTPIVIWIGIFLIISVALLLGIYNAYSVSALKKQNAELIELVKELRDQSNEQCNNVLEATYNSRDIILDTYNAVMERK